MKMKHYSRLSDENFRRHTFSDHIYDKQYKTGLNGHRREGNTLFIVRALKCSFLSFLSKFSLKLYQPILDTVLIFLD